MLPQGCTIVSWLFLLCFCIPFPDKQVWIRPLELKEGQERWMKPISYKEETGGLGKDLYQEGPTGSCSISERERVVQSGPPRQEQRHSAEGHSGLWQPHGKEMNALTPCTSLPPSHLLKKARKHSLWCNPCRTTSQGRDQYGERWKIDLKGHNEEIQPPFAQPNNFRFYPMCRKGR